MPHPETDAEDAPVPNHDRRTLPSYRCIKVVQALKIARVDHLAGGDALIVPDEAGYAPFQVPTNYLLKHQPHAGGYYVLYGDGYESFSPGPQFEAGYVRIEA